MFVFRKIWRALFSCYLRFEFRLFIDELVKSETTILANSVTILLVKTCPNDDLMETPSICLYNLIVLAITRIISGNLFLPKVTRKAFSGETLALTIVLFIKFTLSSKFYSFSNTTTIS